MIFLGMGQLQKSHTKDLSHVQYVGQSLGVNTQWS